jgi:hypothetical protein
MRGGLYALGNKAKTGLGVGDLKEILLIKRGEGRRRGMP